MTATATFPAPFAGPWGAGSGILRNESDRCPKPLRVTTPMDLDRLSDEELIERARREAAHADACLAVLYRRYYPKVAAWCLRIGGDRQEAADLAQEVFLRVHERLDGFPAAPAAGARPRRMPAQAWKPA